MGRPIEIQAYADRIVIRQDGALVGEHRRRFGRGETIYDPWHYVRCRQEARIQCLPISLTSLGQLWPLRDGPGVCRARSFRRNAALTHADWLGLLLDRELTHRRDKLLAVRLRFAEPDGAGR